MLYMLQHRMVKNSFPVKKAHFVGTSVVVTLDPTHVKRLGVDELTFFVQYLPVFQRPSLYNLPDVVARTNPVGYSISV